ncbi:indolepyruvate ferredoxin oxidoreductase subunit alpha [Methanohalophilus profundi]|uniref:indolepyruvate ferredoxin oxidoreductase subunit alpha n=1 Tax=Methanohalophilus profundi TaxID=2138083 RepID=UPI001CDBEFD6
MLPAWIVHYAGNLFTVRPEIDWKKCTACGACVNNCPAEAIHMDRGHAVIDDNKCILCYCCRELCPAEAVKSRKSLVARLLSHS